jgi:sec-independent protein translocase protein TatA
VFRQIGAPEIILILAVVVLLFGAKKLPELARSVGKSTSEFKKGMSEGESEAGETGAATPSETGPSAADPSTDDKTGATE